MTQGAQSAGYRPDIDGLRAVAVGAVVGFHAFPLAAKGGFIGVDIFFVISGFLISGIIFRQLEAGRFSYRDFYSRRIKRIFPALITVLVATLIAGWYLLLPDEFQHLGKHLTAGAGFVSNLALWNEAGYFDASADSKPLLHLWSLGIEEQFYLLWPLALGLVWRRRRGLLAVTVLVAAVSFAINVSTVRSDPVAAFYSPLSRFWELMAGGILAYVAAHRPQVLARGANWRSTAGLLLVAAALLLLTKESAFPGWWALLPVLGTFLLISGGPDAWLNRKVLAARPMVWVGLISYPLYLWHWPILVFMRLVKGAVLGDKDGAVAVAAAVLLAALTYRFVEGSLRHAPGLRVSGKLGAAMAGVAVLGLAVMPGLVHSRLQGEHMAQILAAAYDWEYPPVASNRGPGELRYFVEPNRPGANTLFLGDSNLEQYAPRIDRVIKQHPGASNGAVLVGNQKPCSLLREILVAGHACPAAVARLRELAAADSTRVVVIAASWISLKPELQSTENLDRLTAFIRSLAERKRVYLVLNTPNGSELAPISMFTGSRLGKIVPKPVTDMRFDVARFHARFDDLHSRLRKVADQGGAVVIDPLAHLCPTGECTLFDKAGNPNYLDDSHLTRAYAAEAASYIDVTLLEPHS
jgi:peptidoglycan/LPS O-acetylase OafA/YrhL